MNVIRRLSSRVCSCVISVIIVPCMAITVMEFQVQVYKISKAFGIRKYEFKRKLCFLKYFVCRVYFDSHKTKLRNVYTSCCIYNMYVLMLTWCNKAKF